MTTSRPPDWNPPKDGFVWPNPPGAGYPQATPQQTKEQA